MKNVMHTLSRMGKWIDIWLSHFFFKSVALFISVLLWRFHIKWSTQTRNGARNETKLPKVANRDIDRCA